MVWHRSAVSVPVGVVGSFTGPPCLRGRPTGDDRRKYEFVVLFCLLGLALAGHSGYGGDGGGGRGHENYGSPSPYQFSYSSQDAEGSHAHSQSSDGRRVQGHYIIQLSDGRSRRVDYHADETGFHAKVVTNEQGTESKDAADAIYRSTAIAGEQAGLRYGNGGEELAKFAGSGGDYYGGQSNQWS
ncbi:cuticle protein 10.9-like [Tropilaelaps mercedesae]|uniref:Cuticle protein 10.9-like n=1 Tax=Tropilaelaps mercedesae TaxID=418985 RepID=A0A1V9XKL9_9ACAR|nr:cuticle protein 10.9-like [Tropilaelaps mercedesae]